MSHETSFGDQTVSPAEKTERVGAVFTSVARRYDYEVILPQWELFLQSVSRSAVNTSTLTVNPSTLK